MPIDSRVGPLTPSAIKSQLDRVVVGKGFRQSERMKRFLTLAVERSLLGKPATLKEYEVALAVYDKPATFDPRIDPIVRVEASRLRAKLREYYEDEGRNDPIVISIRKGSYAAVFRKRRSGPAGTLPEASAGDRTGNSEARHLYLKGRYYWNKRSPGAIARSIECLSQAAALDPGYAAAWAGLADCHSTLAWLETEAPARLWQAAETEAFRAQTIDPRSPEALTAIACKKALYDWDWQGSEAGFRAALAAGPRYATARHWYGFFCLAPQRRLSAAREEVVRAAALDPLSAVIGTHLGCILHFQRRYSEAVDQYLRSIELDPTFHLAFRRLGFTYVQLSRFDEALRAFTHARDLGCSRESTEVAVAYLHASAGNGEKSGKILSTLRTSAANYVSPAGIALVHTALGDPNAAFLSLDEAIQDRSCGLVHIKVEPEFDKLKTDPRFFSLLSKLNLL